jgi:hypothetical protein
MERTVGIAIAAVIVIVVAASQNNSSLWRGIQTIVQTFTGAGSGTQVSGDDD